MVNRRTKGREFERWVRDWLEAQGWSVHLCGRKIARMFNQAGKSFVITKGDDIFGADLVAVKLGFPVLFVQATTDYNKRKRLEEFKKYNYDLEHAWVQVWQKSKTKSAQVLIWSFTGSALVHTASIVNGEVVQIKDGKHIC